MPDPPKLTMQRNDVTLPELIALSDYTAPAMPTEHVLRATWARLKRRMYGPEDPLLQHSGLGRASLSMINDLVDPPDCGPLLQALNTAAQRSKDAQIQPCLMPIPRKVRRAQGYYGVWDWFCVACPLLRVVQRKGADWISGPRS